MRREMPRTESCDVLP